MAGAPTVVFPDAAAAVITGIVSGRTANGWDDGDLGDEVPRPRPPKFTTVNRTGGTRANFLVDQPQITVDSWASTWEEAHDLAQRNRALFHALRGQVIAGVSVYRTGELSSAAKLPDKSHQPRYRQNFTIELRGTAP